MQEYVQKSISTTFPFNALRVSGLSSGVLNHAVMPAKSGARPRAGKSVLSAMNTGVFLDVVPLPAVVVVVLLAPASMCPLCELPASVVAQVAFLPSRRALAAAN